jgi:hypothetical protein
MRTQFVSACLVCLLAAAARSVQSAPPAQPPLCSWVDKADIKSLLGDNVILHKRFERSNEVECTWLVVDQALTLTSAANPDLSKLPPPASGMAPRGRSAECVQSVLMERSIQEAQAASHPNISPQYAHPGSYSNNGYNYGYNISDVYNPYGYESCAGTPSGAPGPRSRTTVDVQQTQKSVPSDTAPEVHSNAVIAKILTAQKRKLTLVLIDYNTVTAEQESAVRDMANRLIERY